MADSLTGVTSMAARHIFDDLGEHFATLHGHRIHFTAMGGVDAATSVREGLDVDIVALALDAIEKLEREGHVRAGSRMDYARSGIALAVPAGAPHASIATEKEVLGAMLAAGRIACSTGPSGAHLQALWQRWGIVPEMAKRAVLAPAGIPVAALLARGEADLGLQQWSEFLGQPGIRILGPLPDPIQQHTVFSAATATRAHNPDGARAFLRILHSPQALRIIARHGMSPLGSAGESP